MREKGKNRKVERERMPKIYIRSRNNKDLCGCNFINFIYQFDKLIKNRAIKSNC